MVWRNIERFFIVKGSLKTPQFYTGEKWSKDLRKGVDFSKLKDAEDYLQSSKLRAGRIVQFELIGRILDGRYETETVITERPKEVRL